MIEHCMNKTPLLLFHLLKKCFLSMYFTPFFMRFEDALRV
jgi:hypothetical protein